ncbi:hypothetical protein PanWU01x14_133090, partial [Parasponia andersonii]
MRFGADAPINDCPEPIRSRETIDTNQDETRKRLGKESTYVVDRAAEMALSCKSDSFNA